MPDIADRQPFEAFETLRPLSGRLSRRHWLAGAGASLTALALPPFAAAQPTEGLTADGFRLLRARPGEARLRGPTAPATPIWGYEGLAPGPTLRARQGEELKIRLVNELPQATVIHWHGLRIANAMDGVPHLTQMEVAPGASFDYRFTPPDAGTFWYHSHFLSSEQMARGLFGALIVEERAAVDVDRDVVLVLNDWRLTNAGAIERGFGNFHDAAMAGRLGQYITLNGEDSLELPVKTNERLRLRIVNTANARIFRLRIAEHVTRVMAVDGQPCPPEVVPDGVLRLAPGTRVDLFLDAALKPGSRAPILVDDLRGGELEIGHLVYGDGAPLRAQPLAAPHPLPANPLPDRFDMAGSLTIDVPLDGGGMAMMMRGGGMGGGMGAAGFRGHGLPPQDRIWALASVASSGHDGPPMFSVPRGRTVVMNFTNRSAFPHAMHVHGHHFRAFAGNGPALRPYWLDTVIVDPERSERVVFVADNPGKWMLHCHMIEHMATGMAAWFQVT